VAGPERSTGPVRHACRLFLLLLATTVAHAQQTAQGLAAAVDHHYNALRSLRVHFTQKYDGMGMHREESGTLLLSRAGHFGAPRMRWTYTEPAGKLFVLDGHDAYFVTPGQMEIPRVPAKKLDDLRTPLAFLLGHASLAKDLDHLRLQNESGGGGTLTGVPRGMAQRVSAVEITAQTDGTISRIVVEEADGVRNQLDLAGEEDNVPAPPSAFVFVAPAGTHVIEGLAPM
jgi:outer membrane lipoprotein carrier protein